MDELDTFHLFFLVSSSRISCYGSSRPSSKTVSLLFSITLRFYPLLKNLGI